MFWTVFGLIDVIWDVLIRMSVRAAIITIAAKLNINIWLSLYYENTNTVWRLIASHWASKKSSSKWYVWRSICPDCKGTEIRKVCFLITLPVKMYNLSTEAYLDCFKSSLKQFLIDVHRMNKMNLQGQPEVLRPVNTYIITRVAKSKTYTGRFIVTSRY